jgi:hypothetical protein
MLLETTGNPKLSQHYFSFAFAFAFCGLQYVIFDGAIFYSHSAGN